MSILAYESDTVDTVDRLQGPERHLRLVPALGEIGTDAVAVLHELGFDPCGRPLDPQTRSIALTVAQANDYDNAMRDLGYKP